MAMTAGTIKTTESVIRWYYLPWALLAIAVMVAAIVVDNLWFLDYVHVFPSLLWTGIDLFMGLYLVPSCAASTYRFGAKSCSD